MASAQRKGIFDQFPLLSFDSLDSELETKDDDDDGIKLELLEKNFRKFKTKITRPFTDIEASYLVIISDLSKLRDRIKEVMNELGKKDPQTRISVWVSLCRFPCPLVANLCGGKRE
jgi:hypothetical protein